MIPSLSLPEILLLGIHIFAASTLLTLISWSFGIIFNTTKILHVAHSIPYTISVYIFNELFFYSKNVAVAIIGVVLVTAVLGIIMEVIIYKPLFKNTVNQEITLISSLGLHFLGISIISLFFTDNPTYLSTPIRNFLPIGDAKISGAHIIQICLSMFLLFLLNKTLSRFILKAKAVSDNHIISSLIKIDVNRVRIFSFVLGSVVVGIAALLQYTDFTMSVYPHVGLNVVLSAVVVIMIFPTQNIKILFIISFFLSGLHKITELIISTQLKYAITYILLLLLLLARKKKEEIDYENVPV